ncbi:15474_t:CDS:2, partial [Funneliformis caledonium]
EYKSVVVTKGMISLAYFKYPICYSMQILKSTNNRTIGIVVAFSNDRFLVKAKGSRFRRVKHDDKGKDTLWRISNIRFVIQCKNLRSPYVVRVSQQEIRWPSRRNSYSLCYRGCRHR